MSRTTIPGLMDMQYIYTAGHDNGRISKSIDGISGETVQYAYDSLQRLASAQTTGTQWGEAYSYDGFGNLTGKTVTNGNAPMGTWDIENHLVSQTLDGQARTWGYDPGGQRVLESQTAGSQRLGQIGCVVAPSQYVATCAGQGTETYFGGKLIASTDASGHLLGATDRLGTVRAVQTNGTWAEPTYFPYGEPRTPGGIDGKEQFATYTRDSTASAQDYAGARHYTNVTGWFDSPDPGGAATANPKSPQSWNRYAYVQGDPVNFGDPSGRIRMACPDDPWGPGCGDDGGGGGGGGGGDGCWDNDVSEFYLGPFIPFACWLPAPAPPSGGAAPQCPAGYQNWISSYGAAASSKSVAGIIDPNPQDATTIEADILALSAYESGWGQGNFVVNGGNAFFNLETTKPKKGPNPLPFIYSTGWRQASLPNAKGQYALVATYSSYLNSAMSFAAIKGSVFQGSANPTAFGTAASQSGFGITVSTFVSIADVFIQCLQ